MLQVFDLLEESYKIYPASVVEQSREISVSKRQEKFGDPYVYTVHVRVELSNRESLHVRHQYMDIQIHELHADIKEHVLYRDLQVMFSKIEHEVLKMMDRTDKKPWT